MSDTGPPCSSTFTTCGGDVVGRSFCSAVTDDCVAAVGTARRGVRDADERLPPHTHPGRDIVLHVVEGHLELTLDEETFDLRSGELARFSGDCEISPRAVEPSTAVVVFAPAADD